MLRNAIVGRIVLAQTLVVLMLFVSAAEPQTAGLQIRTTPGARYVAGRGKLIFDDEAAAGPQSAQSTVSTDPKAKPWNVAIEQLGDSVKGRITAKDGSGDHEANIEGTVSGTSVSGKAYDATGGVIATFEGTLSQGRFSGKFRTSEGRVGSWAWDGLPRW